jgi:hypothetical protein
MRITKNIEDQIRHAFNEYDCAKILYQDAKAGEKEKETQFIQKHDALVGLYKQRVKQLEDHIHELEKEEK